MTAETVRRARRRAFSIVLALLGGAIPIGAQAPDATAPGAESSYRDDVARALHEAAMEERERVDDTVLRYTAVVRQRIGAALRMPLKDRTLYRSEASHRLWWDRDGENLVQLLAYREQTPAGVDREDIDLGRFEGAFDPMNDRLFFGLTESDEDMGEPDSDDFWFEHPLYPEYVDRYFFETGDTLALTLPDSRRILAVELQVVPRVADVHRMTGALWIEPESGALVRAVYRLSDTFDAFRDIPDLQEEEDEDLRFVPGIFKPWTADISMIAVDYSLWEFEVWLPRSMRMEGLVAAGILKAPISMDFAYEIESVTTEASLAQGVHDDLPEVRFRTRSEAMAYLNELAFGETVPYEVSFSSGGDGGARYIVPQDRAFLGESPELPPPIWESAPGFASEDELQEMFDDLADLPLPPAPQVPSTFRWGMQRPDLVRFNRVEGVSIGGRWQARPQTFLGPLSVTATARIGLGDLQPNVRLDFTHETLRRRITLSGYNELAAIDEGARHLGLGNSILAAVFGRDDGDYYYRSGGALQWTPPAAVRRTFRVRGYVEQQRPAEVQTEFALFQFWKDSWAFRPNLEADEGWEFGGELDLNPWWGTDPRLAQGGFDVYVQGGRFDHREGGSDDYLRASLVGRAVIPFPGSLRFALEAGGGTSWGDPTTQRLWYVGGPRTLRGYSPRLAGGTAFVRGRGELARAFTFGSVSLFSDWAWAGDRDAVEWSDGFTSVGAGLSIIDGLIRIDGGYGLTEPTGFRLDLYLDAVL
ncbi:MAG: hypothetical protein AMS19_05310 [Gemmatimonas sp. SG8_23]|nr:MAG: hypothetical protein AMS19_05310 [Gemmatimonas sp. SG8_23]